MWSFSATNGTPWLSLCTRPNNISPPKKFFPTIFPSGTTVNSSLTFQSIQEEQLTFTFTTLSDSAHGWFWGLGQHVLTRTSPTSQTHAVSCKVSPLEPLPHDNKDAQAKLKAKTGLSETKVILGWLLNFRQTIIALPEKNSSHTHGQSTKCSAMDGHQKKNNKWISEDWSILDR